MGREMGIAKRSSEAERMTSNFQNLSTGSSNLNMSFKNLVKAERTCQRKYGDDRSVQ